MLEDGILSYKFKYPVVAEGKKLSLLASRKPERYSSAAPLAANARQRIVAELVDFTDRATITVTVCYLLKCMCSWLHAGSIHPIHWQLHAVQLLTSHHIARRMLTCPTNSCCCCRWAHHPVY